MHPRWSFSLFDEEDDLPCKIKRLAAQSGFLLIENLIINCNKNIINNLSVDGFYKDIFEFSSY